MNIVKKAQTHFVMLVIILFLTMIGAVAVTLFSLCTKPFTRNLWFCPGISIRYYVENYHEIPYKTELLVYTFLKTKTKLSIYDCIRYLDCVKDTDEELCKEVYGNNYENETCEKFINETLEKLWNAQIKLDFSGYEFIENEGKIEHSIPVKVEKEISIPFPKRKIKLCFTVW